MFILSIKIKKGDFIPTILPIIISIIVFIACYYSDFINIELKGLNEVLNSIITFTSIIIGVLVALFSLIVSISDSDVMQELRSLKGDRTLFKYCLETLTSNFILLLESIIMQVMIGYFSNVEYITAFNIFLYVWISSIFFVFSSSGRTIYYLLMISFNQKNNTVRPKKITLNIVESEKLKNDYSKNKENEK